ncbi:MAG: hypothetical protein POELPBGB_02039 [Bacteroidia bacterium]|nr:hypothetical protein [Bacteroidia bacterium]
MQEVQEQPQRFKFLKTILIVSLSLIVLIPLTSVVLATLYRDKIKDYVLAEVNKELLTPISISDKVDLTLFQQFPYVSLELNDVFVREVSTQTKKDTLFYFREVYLGFNVLEIINKNYNIKKISAEHGVVKIKRDKEGKGNYEIFKTHKDTIPSSFSLALNEVKLRDTRLYYRDDALGQNISSYQKKIKLKGNFSEKQFTLDIQSEGQLYAFEQSKKEILRNKNLEIELILNVDSEKGIYSFEKGAVTLAQMEVDLTGSIRSARAGGETNLLVEGKNFDVSEIISLLPENAANKLADYSSDGSLYFKANYKGKRGKENSPSLNADFGIEKGDISHKPSGISLKEVSVKGNYTMKDIRKTETATLSVSSFHASLADGRLSGAFSIHNFLHPDVQTTLDAEFDLEKLARFLRLDTLEQISGNAMLNASFRASFNDIENITAAEISHASTSGNVALRDASFKFKYNKRIFNNLNGDFAFNNNELKIEKFSGVISGTDFLLTGYFRNILQYFLLPDQQLYINASAKSKLINLDQLLAEGNSTDVTIVSEDEYHLKLSPNLAFDLMLSAEELKFRKFSAKEIQGEVKLKDGYFTASNLTFSGMSGLAKADLSLVTNPENNFDISCNAVISDIDVQKLFYECENFGQKFITDENLRGRATANINLSGVLSSSLKMDLSKLVVRSNLAISKGELVDFEPLQELSKFTKVEDLNHVKFASMSNNIEIKNKQIIIPLMKIQSSALDLDVSGTHGFNNDMEYHFRVFLSDILFGKARKAKKENEEFGYLEDDGRGKTSLYLTMKGIDGNYKFSYDSKSVRDKIKSDMKKENQNMKALLNEEFGWFKKDTASFKQKEPEKNTELKIEWGEGDTIQKTKEKNQKSLKKVKANQNKKEEPEMKIEFE